MSSQTDPTPRINPATVFVLAVLLSVVAAIPRLYNLGGLSFYMDEETTSFASKSLAEGNGPRMPSGMPYYRALPHSWLNSISARIAGLNNEISYRLPGAILGIISAPLIFVVARPFVGTQVAFLAALLLSLSEWHIIVSRQARMYAPFMFFYIGSVFSILRWAQKDEFTYLALSIILFILAATFHNLGVFSAFIPLIALFIKGYAKTPHYKLIAFSVVAGVSSYFYGHIFINGPYKEWINAHGILSDDTGATSILSQNLPTNSILIMQGALGFILGIWLGRRSSFPDTDNGREFRLLSRYLLAILFGCFASTGQLHGAFLAFMLLMLLYPGSLGIYLKQAYRPLVVIGAVAIIVSISIIAGSGLVPGMKFLLTFPYPNWIVLNEISPGITLLFIFTMLYLAATKISTDKEGILVLLISALFPIIVVGIFKKWAPARYLLEAYPLMLIVSAYAIHMSVSATLKRINTGGHVALAVIPVLLVLSGVLGGHGLIPAYKAGTVQHGEALNEAALVFAIYPDHKFPGEFVARHRRPNDIVIAEDALVQRWYAGKIDYWLRNRKTHMRYLHKDDDQHFRDIYVNSIIATQDLLYSLADIKDRRIWIITSSETLEERDHYLNKEQQQWLEDLEANQTPLFTGKDNITKVYCLNCENMELPAK